MLQIPKPTVNTLQKYSILQQLDSHNEHTETAIKALQHTGVAQCSLMHHPIKLPA